MRLNKITLAVCFLAILFSLLPVKAGLLGGGSPAPVVLAAEGTQDTHPIYMPAVWGKYPYRGFFGVEMDSLHSPTLLQKVDATGAGWVRKNGLLWSQVEPSPGDRKWDTGLGNELILASQRNLEVILVVRSTPVWARKEIGSSACSRIHENHFEAFARFLRDAVRLYSKPPYNVKYWEIWNEPDAPPSNSDIPFGCWGVGNDPNFGGEHYGEMLKVVYPAIKSADPEAQVLVGGLLLDCNPNIADACSNPRPPKYLEGIFEAGAGAYFDGISFHGYDYYKNGLGKYDNPNWKSAWNTTGPVLTEKVKYLRGILERWGYPDKYLINTEVAMIVYNGGCDATCQQTKAYYVAQAFAAGLAAELEANIWYSATGWRESGLFSPTTLEPLPAYDAFAFATSKLGDVSYVGVVNEYSGVTGYKFKRGTSTIWLVWSKDGSNHSVTLPRTPKAIWDALGAAQTVSGTGVTITLKPLYIEW